MAGDDRTINGTSNPALSFRFGVANELAERGPVLELLGPAASALCARAGMDQRDERSASPGARLAGVLRDTTDVVDLDAVERPQGCAAERDDDRRRDGGEGALEEGRARLEFAGARWAVARVLAFAGEWVAEHGVGDEHLGTVEGCGVEQSLKAVAGAIALEGDAGASGTEAAGCLADDQQRSVERAVSGTEDVGVGHLAAYVARRDLVDEYIERLQERCC